MQNSKRKQSVRKCGWPLIVISSVALLAACGGGAEEPAKPGIALSGTVASAGAWANAAVQAKCLDGSGQASTGADGSYKLQVPAGKLPCVLRVADGKGRLLHSVAQGQTGTVVAHITPLTDLLLTRAARLAAASVFDAFSDKHAAALTAEALKKAQTEVEGQLMGTLDTSPITSYTDFPLKAGPAGKPSADTHDQVLDKLSRRVSSDKQRELVQLLAGAAPLPVPPVFKPELSLPSAQISLPMGASVKLSAVLNYPSTARHLRPPVVWSLLDTDGGELLNDGGVQTYYLAPNKKGSYRVKVSRDDFANSSSTLTVNVTDFAPVLEVQQTSVNLMPGQLHRFELRTNPEPGKVYPRQPVSWQVLNPAGGAVSLDGLYTAPPAVGTYQVLVKRDDFPTKSQMIEMKVGRYKDLDYLSRPLQYQGLPPERTLIRDQAAWDAWKKARQIEAPAKPEDSVDFSRQMLVAIVLPEQKQCTGAKLLDLSQGPSALQVTVQVEKPSTPPAAACNAEVWNPVWLLMVAKSDLPLSVIEK